MDSSLRKNNLSIALLADPDISASVLYGLFEVFSSVGPTWELLTGEQAQSEPVSIQIVATSTQLFHTTQGAPIMAACSFDEASVADVVIVPELSLMPGDNPLNRWPEATEWLRKQYNGGAVLCSACTGSLMLAETGLLDGHEATTHWSAMDAFSFHYKKVHLKPERVILPTGPGHRIVTAGGAASWSDLALYLVARFCSEDEARRIAKIFLFGDRGDGQLPFATRARPRQHQDAIIGDIQVWLSDHYENPNPVASMTERSGLTPRTFKRRFKIATGYSPLEYVQTLRIEEAKHMLETTYTPVEDIGLEVGYEDINSFRRLFKRLTAITPHDYRQKFKSIPNGNLN